MASGSSEPHRVLLIDDDEDEFVLVRDFLNDVSEHSYAIGWLSDYAAAEAAIIEGKHDAYLIDYRLGPRTGIDLIQKIRNRQLVRAMIILTGHGDLQVDTKAQRAGASDYLVKNEITGALLDRSIRYAVAASRSESRLQHQAQLLQNVHDAVFLIAPDGTVTTWNSGAARIYGFDEEEIVGTNVSRVFPPGEKDRFSARVYPTVSRDGTYEFVARSIRKDGNEIYVAVRASAFQDPSSDSNAVLICANDITVQKQLEQRTLEISEREQQRIGLDIHDDLCQQLAGIGCLAKVLEKQMGDLYAAGAEGLAQLGKMVTEANVRARGIARGLAPAMIEHLGLKRALEDLAAQSRIVYEIDCSIESKELSPELPQSISVQLFRIAQEAVSNAVNHGAATRVDFTLNGNDDEIRLVVKDNGRGMDSQEASDGLGLLSMRHRAEVLDGELSIDGNTPTGVIISVTVSDETLTYVRFEFQCQTDSASRRSSRHAFRTGAAHQH